MLIRDIMIDKPISIVPQASIRNAVDLMSEKKIGFIVVEENNKPVGVLTEGDMISMIASQIDMEKARVAEYMISPVFSIQADANVFHAYDELVARKMRHLVVVDNEAYLAGVVTMSSFIANLGVEHFADLQTVADVLHPLDVTVSRDMPVSEVIRLMKEHKHAMIVVEENKPVGILTSRGITRLCQRPQDEIDSLCMDDVMQTPVCIYRKSFVPEASFMMKQHRTRHLVAVGDHDEFMGLVTISDVAHSLEGKYVEFMRSVMRDMEHDLLTTSGQNRALFERNPNAVFSLDMKGEIRHVNPASILLTGHASEYLIGRELIELFDESMIDDAMLAFVSAQQGNAESTHLRMKAGDGSVIHVFMSYVPVMIEGTIQGVYAVAYDITERVIAEERLLKLSQALQQAGEPIAITDAYGVIEFANQKMHELFGYGEGELLGTSLTKLEYSDGKDDSGYKQCVWKMVADGVPYKGEFLHRHKDGSLLDVRVSCSPVHVPGAEHVDYYITIYEDMSLRRAAERHALQSQKMETIGTLAGGIAHDFNNYLAAVGGSLYMLKREVAHLPETVERINKLEQLSDRAASLVGQLLTFSRKDGLLRNLISYSALIEETRDLARVLVPKKTDQHWQVAKHVYVDGNATQLQQILLNLLKNACDAVKDVAQPQISVSLSAVEADQLVPEHVELTTERYAKLSVKDNGCGISDRHREHIFDPFFTTKDIGEGTGMGLAMIYGAVQSHQGWIEVDSNEGRGAEFRLFFPMADHIESDVQPGDADKPTLLLVDDEPQVLSLGAEVLDALGYDVVTSANGEDALNPLGVYSPPLGA
ncbi:MAG: CBS domain-containing protein, partial [Mariprofundaceae bacterium]|nr:CBS domain-containing protein [Mariprofundaceae bacterium]